MGVAAKVQGHVGCGGFVQQFGRMLQQDPESFRHSKLIVIWACNSVSTNLHHWHVVKDAQNQTSFVGGGRDLTDVAFEARIDGSGIACEYDDAEIEVEMEVRLEVTRGPAAPVEGANLRYFVAVARTDRTILAREEFGVLVEMPGNRTRVMALDEVSPTIPLALDETGANYLIYLGLSLSDDELDYNRSNRL